ncbi:unnamed protein product [Camellia sinensis]
MSCVCIYWKTTMKSLSIAVVFVWVNTIAVVVVLALFVTSGMQQEQKKQAMAAKICTVVVPVALPCTHVACNAECLKEDGKPGIVQYIRDICYIASLAFLVLPAITIVVQKEFGEQRLAGEQNEKKMEEQGQHIANIQSMMSQYLKHCRGGPSICECFLDYLGCLLEDDSSWCNGADSDPIHPSKSVDCKLAHLSDEVFDSHILIAPAFVQKLFAEASTDSARCPYLANLEIERRKFLFGKGDDDKLIEALMQYFFRQ